MSRDPEGSQPSASEPAVPAPPPDPLPLSPPPVPVIPEKSFEDTDVAWGDYREPDDNERLNRDRPPHWDDY